MENAEKYLQVLDISTPSALLNSYPSSFAFPKHFVGHWSSGLRCTDTKRWRQLKTCVQFELCLTNHKVRPWRYKSICPGRQNISISQRGHKKKHRQRACLPLSTCSIYILDSVTNKKKRINYLRWSLYRLISLGYGRCWYGGQKQAGTDWDNLGGSRPFRKMIIVTRAEAESVRLYVGTIVSFLE